MSHHRPRVLAIRPEISADPEAGDQIMYDRTFAYLRQRVDLDVIALQPIGTLAKYAKIATLTPPECTRYISAANRARVRAATRASPYDAVLLCNEVTFPMVTAAQGTSAKVVALAHNVHSLVAATDPSRLAQALRPLARAFERRYYGRAGVELVAISRIDAEALARDGIGGRDTVVAPPGAPPANPLDDGATILREAVVTGSYGWWRKRRDLTKFAAEGDLGIPIRATDPRALAIFGEVASPLPTETGWWSQGVRFGLVTDYFLGGFKLKSTEYVARNCIVISLSDIRPEFEGLPHAEEFVHFAPDKAAARAVIARMLEGDIAARVDRFRAFKAACLERYDWKRCLSPLDAILGCDG